MVLHTVASPLALVVDKKKTDNLSYFLVHHPHFLSKNKNATKIYEKKINKNIIPRNRIESADW